MSAVRVLAMDHFFDQDLLALEAHPSLEVRRFPYQRLRGQALRMMGSAVATGLEEYTKPSLSGARERYATWVNRELRRMYLERAFDVLVLPSDTFFYVRSLVDAARSLGLPVVVVQKETTISDDAMTVHSQEVRHAAPFVADYMTVCSERHREFWLHAGADGDLIEVTGQPRFDIYSVERRGSPSPRNRVLFLAYELDAYVAGVRDQAGPRTWERLRQTTEGVLLEAVRSRMCDVVVKCHPQQDHRVEETQLARRAGSAWHHGISMAASDADTRQLILNADIVVGFQTTALYEAVAARRAVVYAAWGDEYERFREGLIPFDRAPVDCVTQATCPPQLLALLSQPPPAPSGGCSSWYEEALGPVDGRATDRVARRLVAMAAASHPTAERRALDPQRRRFAVGLLFRSMAAEVVWTSAVPVARVAGEEHRVAVRRRRAREGRHLAIAALRGRTATSPRPRGGDAG